MDKVTLVVVDINQVPAEKFVFRLGLKELSSAGVPAQHLEFALRGFLLKISLSDALLSPLPPGTNPNSCFSRSKLTWLKFLHRKSIV